MTPALHDAIRAKFEGSAAMITFTYGHFNIGSREAAVVSHTLDLDAQSLPNLFFRHI